MLHRKTIDLITKHIREQDAVGTPVTYEEIVKLIESLGGECYAGNIKTDSKLRLTQKAEPPFFVITYKKTLNEHLKMFVIAEELGHLVLHMLGEKGELSESEYSYTPPGNLEARHFAASFLMPEEEFRKVSEIHSFGKCTNVTKIAEHFNTTVQATEVRGTVLGLWH